VVCGKFNEISLASFALDTAAEEEELALFF